VPVGVHGFVRTRSPASLVDRLAASSVPTAVTTDDQWPGVVISVAAVPAPTGVAAREA